MPGISNERIAAGLAQASAVGTVGRGAIRNYAGDAPSTTTAKAAAAGLPPPKASAAPTGSQEYIYTGLCAAMNQYEKDLVKKGTVEIANFYEVQFAPKSLKDELVTIPGATDQIATPMQANNTSKSILPVTNKTNNKARNISVSQGTQIMQFIETTMRNSSYITKQQIAIQDQLTSKDTASNSTAANNTTTWFKINTKTTIIGDKIDTKRNDFAYHITYTITPYKINQSESQYFPQAQFQGVHKRYDYWFTGLNTQVLNFEQSYPTEYQNAISGNYTKRQVLQSPKLAEAVQLGLGPNKNVPSTASAQNDKGAKGAALNPASTLADFLYSDSDQARIKITIVGDPAWIQQGEVVGLNAANFNFEGFYPDGTVNTDAQQAVFAVNWNAPTDYNEGSSGPLSGTGIMDVNAGTAANTVSQSSAAYTLATLKSTFSKGKFEQTLEGTLLKNLNYKEIASLGRTPETTKNIKTEVSKETTPVADVRLSNQQKAGTQIAAVRNFFSNPLKNIGN
jgi:hypothetical protein